MLERQWAFYGLMNALAMALAPALAINLYKVIGYKSALWLAVVAAILMIISIQFVGDHAKPKINSSKKRKLKLFKRCYSYCFANDFLCNPIFYYAS